MSRNSRFRSKWCRCRHDGRRGIPHQDTRPKASRGPCVLAMMGHVTHLTYGVRRPRVA